MGSNRIEFFTATCLNWQNLLDIENNKNIIINSLKFLVNDERIWLYAYVLMPNHIHLLWRKQEKWIDKSIQQHFLKFTAQQIKFNLQNNFSHELVNYKSTQADRLYHFWERRPYKSSMYNTTTLEQKIEYIHNNPVRKKLCQSDIEYKYSSAKYYNQLGDEFSILTHYKDHF